MPKQNLFNLMRVNREAEACIVLAFLNKEMIALIKITPDYCSVMEPVFLCTSASNHRMLSVHVKLLFVCFINLNFKLNSEHLLKAQSMFLVSSIL